MSPTTLELDLLGVRFALACPDPELRDGLSNAWARCLATGPAPRRVVPLSEDDLRMLSGPGQGQLVTSHLTSVAAAESAHRWFNLHAAGVSDGSGRVVALVGESGSGKSTASITLASSGWGYVSDEVVAVDYDTSVTAYPRPVLLDPDVHDSPIKVAHSPDELGLGRCADELTLGRIVVLDRRPGAQSPVVDRLGLIDGVLELIPQISALSRRANPLQRLCRLVERCGGVFRVTYAEAEQLGPVLAELLDADVPPVERWGPPRMRTTRAAALMDAHVRRPPHRDAVATDEEYLVLDDRVPVRLAGIGATIWESCDDAPTIPQLTARVVAAHGPHPEADRLIGQTVATMVQGGVLGWARPVPIERVRAVADAPEHTATTGAP